MPPQQDPRKYYGVFFWFALSAFVVPVFIAAWGFQAYKRPKPQPEASGVDHAVWDFLLKTYVRDGLADYQGIGEDHLFKTYIRQLGAADMDAVDSEDARLARLALLCNAYNAFVIDGVIRHDIEKSVRTYSEGFTGFFKLKEHILAGSTVSLDHVEHGMIREDFEEPRIHFALVCAAKSCPPLRREAYRGPDLERQLEDQTRLFANNTEYISWDAEKEAVMVSSILKWYGGDFDPAGGYLSFLAERVEDPTLKQKLEEAAAGKLPVRFKPYDWSLNALGKSVTPESGKESSGEFSSGSVPNE
jgi:hypothetical protein